MFGKFKTLGYLIIGFVAGSVLGPLMKVSATWILVGGVAAVVLPRVPWFIRQIGLGVILSSSVVMDFIISVVTRIVPEAVAVEEE